MVPDKMNNVLISLSFQMIHGQTINHIIYRLELFFTVHCKTLHGQHNLCPVVKTHMSCDKLIIKAPSSPTYE